MGHPVMKNRIHTIMYRILKRTALALFVCCYSFSAGAVDEDETLTNERVSAFWKSFNNDLSSGRMEVYLSHWAKDAERITPSIHARGIDEIRATYENYLSAFSDFHQLELRRVVDGNVAVSELLTTAKNRKTGKVLTLPNVAIIELNDEGKVKRARVYLDTAKFDP